jgi:hypothetical protein
VPSGGISVGRVLRLIQCLNVCRIVYDSLEQPVFVCAERDRVQLHSLTFEITAEPVVASWCHEPDIGVFRPAKPALLLTIVLTV